MYWVVQWNKTVHITFYAARLCSADTAHVCWCQYMVNFHIVIAALRLSATGSYQWNTLCGPQWEINIPSLQYMLLLPPIMEIMTSIRLTVWWSVTGTCNHNLWGWYNLKLTTYKHHLTQLVNAIHELWSDDDGGHGEHSMWWRTPWTNRLLIISNAFRNYNNVLQKNTPQSLE